MTAAVVPQRPQTVLLGEVVDQEELQGVISLLASLRIDIVDVVTLPESAARRQPSSYPPEWQV